MIKFAKTLIQALINLEYRNTSDSVLSRKTPIFLCGQCSIDSQGGLKAKGMLEAKSEVLGKKCG